MASRSKKNLDLIDFGNVRRELLMTESCYERLTNMATRAICNTCERYKLQINNQITELVEFP